MNRTDRLLSIVLELQRERWRRAADLAATFEVSERTIYRDMQALGEAGVPIRAVPGKGYRLYEGYFLPPLLFTTDEAAMILLGTHYLAEHFDAGYRAAARAARMKGEAVLPALVRDEAARLLESIRFVPVNAFDNPGEAQRLRLLRGALLTQHRVRFHYRDGGAAPGATPLRTVDPYGLVPRGEAWTLVGYHHEGGTVGTYRLDRIDGLEQLDDVFRRPEGYRLQREEAEAERSVLVRVLFDPTVARWVEEAPSFYTVAVEPGPEGVLVTLRVRREAEVIPWLLGWGAHARVLEPASLRGRLAREAEKMAALYREAPQLFSS